MYRDWEQNSHSIHRHAAVEVFSSGGVQYILYRHFLIPRSYQTLEGFPRLRNWDTSIGLNPTADIYCT